MPQYKLTKDNCHAIIIYAPMRSSSEKYKHQCSHKTGKLHDDVMHDVIAEDVDPSVGRFRNMIQTAVVPIKVSFRNIKAPLILRRGKP